MSPLVTGALIAVISSLFGAFTGLILHASYDWYKERRETRNKGLRNHFRRLESDAIKPLVEFVKRIYNIDGIFQMRLGELTFSKSFLSQIDFEQPPYCIFKMHFPNESDDAMKLLSGIEEHNERYEQCIEDIRQSLEEKTQIEIKDTTKTPCIYPTVLDCLRPVSYTHLTLPTN